MKPGDSIEIKGLTHKTKNRIRNHGKCWFIARKEVYNQLLLQEETPKDPTTPYCFWGQTGIDFDIVWKSGK